MLLKCDPTDPYGIIAKVADFGLSRTLQLGQTHLSTQTHGTVTHMPPELLASGKLSPASDVYAFGILLWEMVSGTRPYEGMRAVQVLHRVVNLGERPVFPTHVPREFSKLAVDCWAAVPTERPTFHQIIVRVNAMLLELGAYLGRRASEPAHATASGEQMFSSGALDISQKWIQSW